MRSFTHAIRIKIIPQIFSHFSLTSGHYTHRDILLHESTPPRHGSPVRCRWPLVLKTFQNVGRPKFDLAGLLEVFSLANPAKVIYACAKLLILVSIATNKLRDQRSLIACTRTYVSRLLLDTH